MVAMLFTCLVKAVHNVIIKGYELKKKFKTKKRNLYLKQSEQSRSKETNQSDRNIEMPQLNNCVRTDLCNDSDLHLGHIIIFCECSLFVAIFYLDLLSGVKSNNNICRKGLLSIGEVEVFVYAYNHFCNTTALCHYHCVYFLRCCLHKAWFWPYMPCEGGFHILVVAYMNILLLLEL